MPEGNLNFGNDDDAAAEKSGEIIVPKFKIGAYGWCVGYDETGNRRTIYKKQVLDRRIEEIAGPASNSIPLKSITYFVGDSPVFGEGSFWLDESELYPTKESAKAARNKRCKG